ncbi:uncharacterized protein E0L32_001359 [Thyridium curvatum]|uniref:Flavin-nucleotide-binding protein n=1 Tax=Thyridium curvatum TaxID=1093900 RepID=A0A507AKL1_9PEZI|nr:uncharacterized protein E0L32_001359 [Thyridium curvatum]TPX10162.1 hypothetical protein E0L32_001359 [Thyridium curvatum]
MLGQMGSYARPSADVGDVLDLYLHGYVSSRIMNLSRDSAAAAATGDEPKAVGMPITVAATHFDGLVLALSPNAHSYNYRSAVLFGHAVVVTDVAERLYAMELITDAVVPDRWRNTRVPPNKAEMSSTTILKVSVSHGSAKVRQGMPHDERCDLEDEAVMDGVWNGVVPAYTVMGEPIPSPYNRVKEVPAYLQEWIKDINESRREMAVEEMTKEPEPKEAK